MDQGTITCPNCGHAFELSDALTHQIRDHLKTELQAEVVRREAEAKRKLDEVKAKEDALARARDALNEEVEKQLREGRRLGRVEDGFVCGTRARNRRTAIGTGSRRRGGQTLRSAHAEPATGRVAS